MALDHPFDHPDDPSGAVWIDSASNGVWVTSDYRANAAAEDVVVVRIDPQSNRAVETIAVGGHPIDVAATEGAVWLSVADPGTVLRIARR